MMRISFVPDGKAAMSLVARGHLSQASGVPHGSGWLVVWRPKSDAAEAEMTKLGAVHLPSILNPAPIGTEHAGRFDVKAGITGNDSVYAASKKASEFLGWAAVDPDRD